MEMREICIDMEIHKAIEMGRLSFKESDNDVLRRLLNIDLKANLNLPEKTQMKLRDFQGDGHSPFLRLKHGTELKIDYANQSFEGVVDDGMLVFDGQSYKSPTAAVVALCRTKWGARTNLNGKKYMFAKSIDSGSWESLLEVERRLAKKS